MKIYYFAYGPNFNKMFMQKNCPNAIALGVGYVNNKALEFVGFAGKAIATLVDKPNGSVPVLVWEIEQEEKALILNQSALPITYASEEIKAQLNGETISGIIYVPQNNLSPSTPAKEYLNIIKEGYEQAGLDSSVLNTELLV